MGYTHYWQRPRTLDRAKLAAAADDCRKVAEIAAERGIALAGPLGEGSPEFGPDVIALNGRPDYESFVVERVYTGWRDEDEVFEFCKTARLPYDAVVTACLVALKHHFGDAFRVSSDGRIEDWAEGLEIAREAGIEGDWDIVQGDEGRSLERAAQGVSR